MGPMAEWEKRIDILAALARYRITTIQWKNFNYYFVKKQIWKFWFALFNIVWFSHGMHHLLEAIFLNLASADLRSVRLVSTCWFGLVEQLIHHGELCYLSKRWRDGEPKVGEMQVDQTFIAGYLISK